MGIELNSQQIYASYDIENWYEKGMEQVYNLSGCAGTGKAQPIDTLIPTPNGIKRMGDLKVGDYVYGRNGEPTLVKGIFDRGRLSTFKVTFADGRHTYCNDDHIWCVLKENSEITMTLKEMINNPWNRYCIPANRPIMYENKPSCNDAYKVGYFMKDNIIIPDKYMESSYEQRMDLLYGILKYTRMSTFQDDVISIDRRCYSDEELFQFRNLLNSLGLYPRIIEEDDCFRVIYNRECNYDKGLPIVKIEDLGLETEMRCIQVDAEDGLYITNDYIVTHNTTVIRYVIERLGLELHEVAFIAYMGKAAMQMARNGLPAQTIHSFIYYFEKVVDRDGEGKMIFTTFGKPKMKMQFSLKEKLPKGIKLIVVDEASMVSEAIALDILSFGKPIIALGDLNQLPPIFGKPYFLKEPNYILTQIMRQNENNPIVWLSQRVLNDLPLQYGVYGTSSVIQKSDMNEFMLSKADMVITVSNKLRREMNLLFREHIRCVRKLDVPEVGEKVMCVRNNWNRSINDSIFLTNGMTGTIDFVDMESFNGKSIKIDFKPDFLNKRFKNISVDYPRLFANTEEEYKDDGFSFTRDQFEFAYAITCAKSQGSEYPSVIFLNEDYNFPKDYKKKLMYTAITRASEQITVVQ